jgi:recombinational DNA repair protein (RecF pathway)
MKGFVLSISKAKNEDIIVMVLTSNDIKTYYRFFGARHSILQVGYMIDFEVEGDDGRFLPRLRSISQIPFEWIFDKNRLLIWQNYIKLFAKHLKDATHLDSFYFDLLLENAKKWHKQNPKRIVCDSYIKLLKYEGRLYQDDKCFICQEPIEEQVSLMQSFKLAHPHCIYQIALPTKKLIDTLKLSKSIYMDDNEVDYLYDVVMKGF